MGRGFRDEDDDEVTLEEQVYIDDASDKAIRVNLEGDNVWIPRSVCIGDCQDAEREDRVDIIVQEWWAQDRGYV